MGCPPKGGLSPENPFMLKFESIGKGFLGPWPGRLPPHGLRLPVVFHHLHREQFARTPDFRVRRSEDPEPAGGRHVCDGHAVLRLGGDVRLSPPDVHDRRDPSLSRAPPPPPVV